MTHHYDSCIKQIICNKWLMTWKKSFHNSADNTAELLSEVFVGSYMLFQRGTCACLSSALFKVIRLKDITGYVFSRRVRVCSFSWRGDSRSYTYKLTDLRKVWVYYTLFVLGLYSFCTVWIRSFGCLPFISFSGRWLVDRNRKK